MFKKCNNFSDKFICRLIGFAKMLVDDGAPNEVNILRAHSIPSKYCGSLQLAKGHYFIAQYGLLHPYHRKINVYSLQSPRRWRVFQPTCL